MADGASIKANAELVERYYAYYSSFSTELHWKTTCIMALMDGCLLSTLHPHLGAEFKEAIKTVVLQAAACSGSVPIFTDCVDACLLLGAQRGVSWY